MAMAWQDLRSIHGTVELAARACKSLHMLRSVSRKAKGGQRERRSYASQPFVASHRHALSIQCVEPWQAVRVTCAFEVSELKAVAVGECGESSRANPRR